MASLNIYNPVEILLQNTSGDSVLAQGSPSGLLATISAEQWLTILGRNFTSSYFWKTGNEVENAGTRDILIQCNENLEFSGIVGADGGGEVEFYAGTTFSDAGLPVPIFNKNTILNTVSSTVVTRQPTVIDVGMLTVERLIPSGGIFGGGGGQVGGSQDGYVFLAGTVLLVRIVNVSGAPQRMQVTLFFSR